MARSDRCFNPFLVKPLRISKQTRIYGNARLLCGLLLGVGIFWASASAGTLDSPARLVGKWTLSWPKLSCQVNLEIAGDGAATLENGSQIVRSTIGLAGATAVDGSWRVSSKLLDTRGSGCKLSSNYPTVGFGDTTFVRILAKGNRLALCAFNNIGGCKQWYDRAGPQSSWPSAAAEPTLSEAVEQAIYAAIPEQLGLFELAAKDSSPVLAAPDAKTREAAVIDCPARVGFYISGSLDGGFGQIYVSVCKDGARLKEVSRRAASSDLAKSIAAQIKDPVVRRRYGLVYDEEPLENGTFFYHPGELMSVDAGIPLSTAVWVAQDQGRAIVAQLIAFADCEPSHQYASLALCQDRVALFRKVLGELARNSVVRP